MKRIPVILGNALIVLATLTFVMLYAGNQQHQILEAQTDGFINMTVAMEHVTTNYLIGEQRVCDSWAKHINAGSMTAEEAVEFLASSVTDESFMAHVLFVDNDRLTGAGMSTMPEDPDYAPDNLTVDYRNIDLFPDGISAFFNSSKTVYVTRTYNNPINGRRSIAFCNQIRLMGPDHKAQTAILLRIIPESAFRTEWAFPTNDYKDAEIALLNAAGDYVISGESFQSTNFFEFYQYYNDRSNAARDQLTRELTGDTGSFEMNFSVQERCIVAHTRVNSTDDWIVVTMVPLRSLAAKNTDWTLVVMVSTGLLLLLLLNLSLLWRANQQARIAAATADRASRAKTDFLSTMSHDIRTPMNAIIGLTTITEKNIEDNSIVRENLHKIKLASNHLLTLINDILDISKVESGKLNLSPATFSIVECAENLVNISQPMVKEKNIDFSFRVNHFDHEHLYADQLRLNQIYINLLSNAVKYTPPGGRVWINMQQAPGSTDKTVRLTYVVGDTGIGMSPEFMEHMYQPFSRQTDSRVNAIQGTGLGLAITKQMIDLMHGTIDCQSEPGKGTVFTVNLELPLADMKEEEMLLEPMQVLVVDDDTVLLETAKDTLRSIGIEADVVSSGAEALSVLTGEKAYRLVILDWKMPEMDGIETARNIRARIGEHVPILLISAYDWSDLEEVARDAGVNGFISKPLFRSTLYKKLSELVGNPDKAKSPEEDNSDIAGMHILVAEDNDINWEIISMLLQMHGITSERAENGQLAVERLTHAQKGEFNLVFMDIQMPVMNGLDATRAIRSLPDSSVASIPIIALTADAFSENVAECIAAGMNGHIAKPIDMKQVLKEIRRIREVES